MKYPFLVGALLAVVLAGSQPCPAMSAQHSPPTTATQAVPVLAPVRGQLTDIFFAAGERVKRGQILAKLLRADASGPAYLLAPAAGRIGPARQHLGESLAAHATLAVIELVPAR